MTRVSVPAIDAILGKQIPVLDEGFVRVIDYMGSDESIVQAARISYGKGTTSEARDRSLLFYLMRHKHTSPFEMCEIKLHIKMPIFIARQWIRHRTANVNEFSARYSFVPDSAYLPETNALGTQSAINHQATIYDSLKDEEAQRIQSRIKEHSDKAYETYLWCLNRDANGEKLHDEHSGISREAARCNLSLNYYTELYWKIDLHNLLHFLHLRAEKGAQREIRLYAEAIIENILKPWTPWSYEAFINYRQGACMFSKNAMLALQDLAAGKPLQTPEHYNLSKLEWNEVLEALKLPKP